MVRRPTWLLLDHDWASTLQAAPFLSSCSNIVVVGRVKWIEGSKYTGKDNYAWFRFDAMRASGPVFHGRDRGETSSRKHVRVCEHCGGTYEPERSSARFCSLACRQSAYRKRRGVTPNVTATLS
jgi:hypothetical protein